jgi:plastocyanin
MRLALLCCALLGATKFGFAQATVEGRVELPKTRSAPVMTKRYEIVTTAGVLGTNPPLAVVYLEGSFPKPANLPTKQVAQKDMAFLPALLPAQVGTKVEFPNLEKDTYHNIFSYSPAKRFDLGRYRPDEKPVPSQIFDVPGLVTLRCDIHEHMRGLILVLATPHFATTDENGHFRLSGLPAGHYTLKAWMDSRTTREQPVDLKSGATVHVEFP